MELDPHIIFRPDPEGVFAGMGGGGQALKSGPNVGWGIQEQSLVGFRGIGPGSP